MIALRRLLSRFVGQGVRSGQQEGGGDCGQKQRSSRRVVVLGPANQINALRVRVEPPPFVVFGMLGRDRSF